MRKKILILILFTLLISTFVGCSGIIPINLSANFTATGWNQSHTNLAATFNITKIEQNEWSDYVYIYYEIENTGNVNIDYYQVWFTVSCSDGSEYTDWTNGLDLKMGDKRADYDLVNISGKTAVSAKVKDFELTNYSYDGEWGSVRVDYTIENTCGYTIDYYKVWFTATTAAGYNYTDWTNGINIEPGQIKHDFTFIDVDYEVVSVEVTDWELTHW
jgi:hypothetical protein